MRGRERRSKSSGILFFRIAVWNMEYGMGFELGVDAGLFWKNGLFAVLNFFQKINKTEVDSLDCISYVDRIYVIH